MKKNDIKIGGVYSAKITDRVVPARIERENPAGGLDAVNLNTKRSVRIKSAAKLRGKVAGPQDATTAATSPASGEGDPKATKEPTSSGGATRANTAATGGKGKATSGGKASKAAKPAKPPKPRGEAKAPKRPGILDVAARILAKADEPMGCKAIVEQAIEQKLWTTTGKTPHATLYAAIIREIQAKGDDARFEKVQRGRFQARDRKSG